MTKNCVVLGAGIIGVSVAFRLAQQGVSVSLVDSRMPASGTTGTSGSLVGSNEKRPYHYFQLGVQSMAAMRRLAGELDQPSWFLPTGHLEWGNSPETIDALEARVSQLQQWSYPAQWLTPQQVESDLEPELEIPTGVERIAFFSDDSIIYPHTLLALLLRRLRSLGVECHFGVGDATIVSEDGRISGLRLANGQRIDSDVVVSCVGRSTGKVLAPLGVVIPLVSPWDVTPEALGFQVITTAVPTDIRRMVRMPGLSIRPAGGGRLMLHGRPEEMELHTAGEASALRWDHPMPSVPPQAEALLAKAKQVVPYAGAASVQSATPSIRALTQDGYPAVGWVSGQQGLYVAVTHSGIGLGPLLGELMAEEIIGSPVDLLEPYRPSRFDDGGAASSTSAMRKIAPATTPTN